MYPKDCSACFGTHTVELVGHDVRFDEEGGAIDVENARCSLCKKVSFGCPTCGVMFAPLYKSTGIYRVVRHYNATHVVREEERSHADVSPPPLHGGVRVDEGTLSSGQHEEEEILSVVEDETISCIVFEFIEAQIALECSDHVAHARETAVRAVVSRSPHDPIFICGVIIRRK